MTRGIAVFGAFIASLWMTTAAATNWSTATHQVVAGDFNGDNHDDLLVIAKDPNGLSGIFASGSAQIQSWPSGYLGINWQNDNYTAITADFNGDGRDDVFLQSNKPGNSFVLLTNSSGHLFAIHQFVSDSHLGLGWSAQKSRIVAGDFDGNGRDELLLQPRSSAATAIVAADGNGHLTSIQQSWANNYLGFRWSTIGSIVHVGDFNNDRRDDVLVQARPSFVIVSDDIPAPIPVDVPQSYGIVLSNASGQIATIYQLWNRRSFGVDWSPLTHDIVIGDYNGDGRDDVLLVSRRPDQPSYLVMADGNGQMSSSPVQTLSAGSLGTNWNTTEYRMLSGDFDNDGRADIYRQATSPSGTNSIVSTGSNGAVSAVTTHNAPSVTTGLSTAIGRVPGEFSIDANGAATYEIPLDLPTGTNGLKPNLSLGYSSVNGSGSMGIGWGLSGLSAISRCPSTIAQDGVVRGVELNGNDRFCLNGNRLRVSNDGAYGANGTKYATEIDVFSRVTSYTSGAEGYTPSSGPQYFKVEGKDGLYYYYGYTADSRIEVKGTSVPRVWALNRVEDRSGNSLTLTYTKGVDGAGAFNGSYRPDKIEWARTAAGTGPYYKVTFVYETRPSEDIDTSYFAGGSITEDKRIDRVDVHASKGGAWTLVHNYEVTYESFLSVAGNSRVASITQCSASVCLPATTFQYNDAAAGWTSSAHAYSYLPSAQLQFANALDFDGDGRTDLVYPEGSTWRYLKANSSGQYDLPQNTSVGAGSQYNYALSIDYDGDGRRELLYKGPSGSTLNLLAWSDFFNPGLMTSLGTNITESLNGKEWVADFDGDGLEDFLFVTNNQFGVTQFYVRRNTTTPGLAGSVSFAAPVLFHTWNGSVQLFDRANQHLVDFNGDGKSDLFFASTQEVTCGLPPNYKCQSQVWTAFLSTGTSFNAVSVGSCVPQYPNYSGCTTGLQGAGDFNGDGLTDLVVSTGYTYNVGYTLKLYYGSGSGAGVVGGPTFVHNSQGTATAADYDGDGRMDLIVPSTAGWQMVRSLGTSFAAAVSLGIPYSVDYPNLATADIDGDGRADLGYVTSGSWQVRRHLGSAPPDTLSRVTDGLGNYVAPTYSRLTDAAVYTKGTGAEFPVADVKVGLPVVASYQASSAATDPNSFAATYTVSYKYEAARVHQQGRGFLGFAKRTRTDGRPNGLITVEEFNQAFPYLGTAVKVTTYQSNGTTKVEESEFDFDERVLDASTTNRRVFVYPHIVEIDKFEVGAESYNGTQISRSTTTSEYDNYGNLTTQDVVAKDMDANSPLNGAEYKTGVVNTVNPDVSTWCITAVTRAVISSQPYQASAAVSRTKSFDIDYNKCRADGETVEPDIAALRVDTDYGYYPNGQIETQTVTGANMTARVTRFEYHPAGPLVTRQINALNQSVYSEWDIGLEQEKSRTDLNGKILQWEYDTLGRKIAEIRPDGTRTDYQYYPCVTGCGYATGKYQIVSTSSAGGVSYGQSAVVYDQLGRTVQTTEWLLGGAQSHVLTEYDLMGRAYRTSAPLWTGGEKYWSTSFYDAIGRSIETQRPVSESSGEAQSMRWYYEGMKGRQVDANGKQITRRSNVIGQVVQMTDAAGSHTWYQYDAFGNNTRTFMGDANGNETTGTAIVTQYDLRGRKDWSNDPDMGQWDYTFNALDELVNQTDANNKQVSFQYDLLGRMTHRTEEEGLTRWYWDTATNGVGQLDSVTQHSSSNTLLYSGSHSYDSLGRPATVTTTIDGVAYDVTTTYNSSGQVETVEYPRSYPSTYRFKIRYAYDNGIVKKITDDTGSGKVYWEALDTDAAGVVASEKLGNGIGISSWYDKVSGALRQRDSGPGFSGSTQALEYQWDRMGNLDRRSDAVKGVTENFYYDNLYRLDYSTLTTGGSTFTNLDVVYNELGNITSMTGAGTYTYHPTKKHAVTQTQIGGQTQTYGYDANGNMTSRAGSVIDWYSYNLPKVLRSGANSSTFYYGPTRDRYKQLSVDGSDQETTIYVGGLLERVVKNGGAIEYKHYIPASEAGGAIYTRRDNGVHDTRYLTKDHLGSIDTISDESGTVLARLAYDAFGQRRDFIGTAPSIVDTVTHRGFTGHEMLDNLELVHMNGRVYDPRTGRFISADPFVQAPLFSQSLNRYSYVANNPLSYTDPSGYSWISKVWRQKKRIHDKIRVWAGDALPAVVAVVAYVVCVVATEGAGAGGCVATAEQAYAWTSAAMVAAGDPPSSGGAGPPSIGNTNSGTSLPPGTIVFLQPSIGGADSGQGDDLYGDPLFDMVVEILKGTLIPGYDLYLVYSNPNATWTDWAMAIGSTAISLSPLKAAQLVSKVYKVVQKSRAARKIGRAIEKACCFAAGTPVETLEGAKPIESLDVGDLVLARDEMTGETAYKPITHVFVNNDLTVWTLDVIDENGQAETHHVTNNHPYAVVGHGWMQVAELQPGMQLESDDGTRVTVLGARDTWVVQQTYNLEVADFHTFFVGERRVLVHNSKLCDGSDKVPDLNMDEAAKGLASSVSWKGFSKRKLAEHFEKHGAEFGNISQSQYLKMAKDFSAEAGVFLEKKVGNFVVKYDPATRRTLVGHVGSREIRTFYKADGRSADPFADAVELARQLGGG